MIQITINDPHKKGVEFKAGKLADQGYKMVGAPYFIDDIGLWFHDLLGPPEDEK